MGNFTTILKEYLGKMTLPHIAWIDIIEILLIAVFCLSVHALGKKYPGVFSAERNSDRPGVYLHRLPFKDEHDPLVSL